MNLRELMFIFAGLLIGVVVTGLRYEAALELLEQNLRRTEKPRGKCPYVNVECSVGPQCDGCENERYDH